MRALARCNCQNRTCSCVLQQGENIAISGSGTAATPYVITGTGGAGGGTVPVGAIMMWGTPTPPTGWLICDGAEQLVSSYTALNAVIGQRFGGNGTTTFRTPAYPGRVPVGVNAAPNAHALAGLGGAYDRTLVNAQMPQHTHTIGHVHAVTHNHGAKVSTDESQNHTHNINPPQVATGAHAPGAASHKVGAGTAETVGDDSGNHTHNINIPAFNSGANSRPHKHTVDIPALTVNTEDPSNGSSGQAGSSTPQPVNVEQPWLGIYFIIKT